MTKPRVYKSSAERVAKHVAKHSCVAWRECADPSRREQLEHCPADWMRHYFPNVFYRPFEDPHYAIIEGATTAIKNGERFVVAAERGIGKSVIEWSLVMLDVLTGTSVFPAYIPWQASAVKRAFRFWRNALCFNAELLADYPEYCAPFTHSRGVSQRLMSTWWEGGPRDGEPTGAQLAISDGIIVLPDSRGCIGSATINGNPRGLNHPTADGKVLRPTSAILDDVQDRDVAKSERIIGDTIRIIDGDVAGMGEAGKKLPMLMSGNCIEDNDVMAHYLCATNWQGIRVPCVLSWPEGWEDGDGPIAQLWFDWYSRYKNNQPHKTWYRKHKKILTKGFKLSAPGVFAGSDDMPDSFCGVIESYYRMGKESFHAEKQQKPLKQGVTLYNLKPQTILDRVDKTRPAGKVPEWAMRIIAATDINRSYALSSVVVAFGPDQRAAVLWYGKHPMAATDDMTPAEIKRLAMEALAVHGKELSELSCRPERWIIDGGGTPKDSVNDFAANAPRICGIPAIGSFGRSSKNYRVSWARGKKRRIIQHEESHEVRERVDRGWIIWNADYWREQAQRGWTGTLGAPGSCDLPRGNHREFAEQICNEQLTGKVELNGRWVYDWKTTGTHDYGDCMAMAYAMAGATGIGTGGKRETKKTKRKNKRRVRHVSI